jgi:hypothetical protein
MTINTISPIIARAQSAGSTVASIEDAKKWDVLFALQSKSCLDDPDVNPDDGSATPLEDPLTVKHFNDSDWSPLNSKISKDTFGISKVLFGSKDRMTCKEALAVYYNNKYSGADISAKRKAFILDYYEQKEVGGDLTLKIGRDLKADVADQMAKYADNQFDSLTVFHNEILHKAFRTCWKWDTNWDVKYPTEKSATDKQKRDPKYWTTTGAGNPGVGFVEGDIETQYEDGVMGCGNENKGKFLKDHFDLINYNFDSEYKPFKDSAERQHIFENVIGLFLSSDKGLRNCISFYGSEKMKSDGSNFAIETANWLADGGSGTLTSLPPGANGPPSADQILVSDAEGFKTCLAGQYPTLESIVNYTIEDPAFPKDTGGTDTTLDDSCSVHITNPLSWILCPVIDLLELGVNTFFTAANAALNFTFTGSSSEKDLFAAWSAIKNIANVLFIISFLIIIISQTMVGKF